MSGSSRAEEDREGGLRRKSQLKAEPVNSIVKEEKAKPEEKKRLRRKQKRRETEPKAAEKKTAEKSNCQKAEEKSTC